jgi:hypothetical protein
MNQHPGLGHLRAAVSLNRQMGIELAQMLREVAGMLIATNLRDRYEHSLNHRPSHITPPCKVDSVKFAPPGQPPGMELALQSPRRFNMARTISMTIPHKLTQQEVRTRISKGIADAQRDHAGKFSKLEHNWTENHLNFEVGVLGQSITGAADVNPADVVIHVNLPWMLAAFADKIQPQIRAQADKLLAEK